MKLEVFRCHPTMGAKIVPAERTLRGEANEAALKWCGPYNHANKSGWWLFPPCDVDILYLGDGKFEHKVITEYTSEDLDFVHSLDRESDSEEVRRFCQVYQPRMKLDFGRVEPNICQMWTGCVFRTPPGWGLHIRSPINVGQDSAWRIQEGILETDWMQYDIWMNVAFVRSGEWVKFRRDQWPPIAQILPVRRETYDKWEMDEKLMSRDDESSEVYCKWMDYNYKKYLSSSDGQKDSGTYHKERARYLGKRTSEPKKKKVKPKPPEKLPKALPKRFITQKKNG